MNKNVPNIINTVKTVDVLTNITCLKAFVRITLSPVTHAQLLFGLHGSLTQEAWEEFYKASDWLEKGPEQQDIKSLFMVTALLVETKGCHRGSRGCPSLCLLPPGCYEKAKRLPLLGSRYHGAEGLLQGVEGHLSQACMQGTSK